MKRVRIPCCSKTTLVGSSRVWASSKDVIYSTSICNGYVNTSSSYQKRFYVPEKTITFPPAGDSITEGELKEFSKEVGEVVVEDDVVCSIETDKVTLPIRVDVAGTVTELLVKTGEVVKVGQPLFKLTYGEGAAPQASKPKEQPQESQQQQQQPQSQPEPKQQQKQQTTPPSASTQTPPTSTPQTSSPKASSSTQTAPQKAPTPAPGAQGSSEQREYRIKASKLRARVAERLKGAQNTYALLTTFQECDMSNLIQMREDMREQFEKTHKVKLGFMSAFVKASAAALKAQPIVNAVYDDSSSDGPAVVYRNYVDISVAVATPKGLIVPVLRNCDRLSFADVEKGIGELANRAKEDRITLEDMAGGTFTISNGGVYGSMMGTPIVNPPQSAILGMHAITKRAVVVGDKVEVRPMMYLALTYDHRLIDGKEAVTFLRAIKLGVEDPRRLLLEI